LRKLLYTVGFAAVLFFNATIVKAADEVYYTNRNGIEMTEQQYNNLLGLGFTELQIDRMNNNEFQKNKDVEAELVSTDKKYINIRTTIINGIKHRTIATMTEEEYEVFKLQTQQMQSLGPIYNPNISGSAYDGIFYDTSLCETTSMSYVPADNSLQFKLDLDWEELPPSNERFWDIMGIGIEQSKIHIGTTIDFREDWTTTSNVSDYDEVCAPKIQATGGSAMFRLPSASLSELSQYLYFRVYKNSGVGTITDLIAVGHSAHAIAYYDPDVPGGVYYNYDMTTIGLTVYPPYGSYYLMPGTATASFVGQW